jgi:hypothetical protein
MQLRFKIAVLAASALLLQPSDAETESHVHMRVTTSGASLQKAAEWQQCKWIDKTASCDSGLTCVVQNDYYGQCIKSVANLWGQCGGYGWTGSCVSGAACQKKDDYYSQCVPSTSTTVAKWGQCHFDTYDKTCADNLWCCVQSTYYGVCVPKGDVALNEQCGGTLWTASCKTGTCVMKSNHYSVCEA